MNRCEWFRKAGWGIFLHFLASSPGSAQKSEMSADDWNRQVDVVDANALAKQVAAAGVPQVIHIGCEAAAFARDIGLYRAAGYTVEQIRVFDSFPLTHHVECVALLTR